MSDKLYSAKEAALMVLSKAQELYKASDLAKGNWAKIHSKLKREGYSEESADKIDGAIKAKMGKSEEMPANPDQKADAALGEKVEQDVQQHEEQNEDPKHEIKGHIKLAKFMGRMDHKKEQKAKAMDKSSEFNPNIKGVHNAAPGAGASSAGISARGSDKNMGQAKEAHKEVLSQMQSMPKPKLPG
jgi:hypothetical protein